MLAWQTAHFDEPVDHIIVVLQTQGAAIPAEGDNAEINIRSEAAVERDFELAVCASRLQAREIEVVVNCKPGAGLVGKLDSFRQQICNLAGVGRLEIGEESPRPEGSVAAGLTELELYVPLKGIIDIESEKSRLSKGVDKLSIDLEKIEARLGDDRFLSKAPADVIDRERERFSEMSERMQRLKKILEDL